GLSAMFAADAELQLPSHPVRLIDGDLHERADAVLVERLEWIAWVDPEPVDVWNEEAARVVARHAERGLGQVVGAEREEIGGARAAPPPRAAGTRATADRWCGSSRVCPASPGRCPRNRCAGTAGAWRAPRAVAPASRRGSSRASGRACPRRRTCARSGRVRCPRPRR